MPFPCRAHVVPLPCRAPKGLECVFPIWFTQWGRARFTLAMPCPCHAPTMPFFSRPQHSTAVSRRPCCAVALRRTARSEHGVTSVKQTRPHCVNQMGKTHSKPLSRGHTILMSRELMWCYTCSWDVREAIYHWILWRRFTLLSPCLRHVISRASTPITFLLSHTFHKTWRHDLRVECSSDVIS